MSQNVYVERTLQFNIGGGGSPKVIFDTDDSSTILYIRPGTDDTGAIYFGDGTKDMDVRFVLGTAADYIQMDVGAKQFITAGSVAVVFGNTMSLADDLTLADTANLILSTTTGTKIGTTTAQKLGFWSASPVVRPGAITQTYTTAAATANALTSATLTDSSGGSSSGTIAAIVGTASDDSSAAKNAIASLTAQVNALRVDLVNIKGVQVSVVDAGQAIGIWG